MAKIGSSLPLGVPVTMDLTTADVVASQEMRSRDREPA